MKINLKDTSLQILIKVVCMIIIGFVFLGSAVLSTSNDLFSYTIFGLSIILFYYMIRIWGIKESILPAAIVSVIFILTLLNVSLISSFFKYLLCFIFFGALVYYISEFEKGKKYSSLLFILLCWFLGPVLVYFVVGILNVYVFKLYILSEYESIISYCFNEIKTGAVLGISLSIGALLQIKFLDIKRK